jgi:hypothetical protein
LQTKRKQEQTKQSNNNNGAADAPRDRRVPPHRPQARAQARAREVREARGSSTRTRARGRAAASCGRVRDRDRARTRARGPLFFAQSAAAAAAAAAWTPSARSAAAGVLSGGRSPFDPPARAQGRPPGPRTARDRNRGSRRCIPRIYRPKQTLTRPALAVFLGNQKTNPKTKKCSFWAGKSTADELTTVWHDVEKRAWTACAQGGAQRVALDSTLYDQVLDAISWLGLTPERFQVRCFFFFASWASHRRRRRPVGGGSRCARAAHAFVFSHLRRARGPSPSLARLRPRTLYSLPSRRAIEREPHH